MTPSFRRGLENRINLTDARELFIYERAPQQGVIRVLGGTYSFSLETFKLSELMMLVKDHSKVENWTVAIMTVGAEGGFRLIEYRLPRHPGSPVETFRAAMDMAGEGYHTHIYVHPVARKTDIVDWEQGTRK